MIPLIVSFIFLLSASATAAEQTAQSTSGTVAILSTNDFHGRTLPFATGPSDATSQASDPGADHPFAFDRAAEVGGFPRLASAVKKIKQERGAQNVILVHAGDTFSDDLLMNLTRGKVMIALMNELGYDFMAFGNHDFDYGFERTRELAQKSARAGERVRDIRIGGEAIAPQRLYTVVTHTGMLDGIHRYETFKQGRKIRKSDRQINEIVEKHLRERREVRVPKMGRITIIR